MTLGNITQKAILISKTTGQKHGFSKKDVVSFINKNGELSNFTVFKDEHSRPVRNILVNEKTGAVKERMYSYHKYTFENGETVPYKVVMTKKSEEPQIPLTDSSTVLKEREIIATVQNGEKLDVTKTKSSFSQPEVNGNIFETSSIQRFSNGKKPIGVASYIERTPEMDIIKKKTSVQKADGKTGRIIPDLFYNTATYDEIMFKREIISMLKSEMGLKEYGITVKPAHRGYTPGGRNNMARYVHKRKEVSLNVDVPFVNSRKGFTSQVSHELLHAYQHREVELLELGLLSGARKEAAQIYQKEFSNYIKPSKTDSVQTAAYKSQVIETKAREFQKFVEEYYMQNIKNIYNKYVHGIIPPQIGITKPLPPGTLKNVD